MRKSTYIKTFWNEKYFELPDNLIKSKLTAFKFGFNKITLDIDDGNAPSETLAKRNGYKLARRLPLASYAKCVGKCDSLIYEKIKISYLGMIYLNIKYIVKN